MRGTLYVVATPIGNLEDVTLRALRVLREVNLIAAEDTRRTARLLQHYSISTKTTSLHQHNERLRTPELLARLAAGESIAIVSDAGTPVVSDPGTSLVAAAHAAGIRVEPVPGPSAAIAALSASGLPTETFTFVGFPPARGTARREWFADLARGQHTTVAYEAPHRVVQTLTDLLAAVGDRSIAVARELTKLHENLVIKPISRHIADIGEPRGEYTLVISGPISDEFIGSMTYTDSQIVDRYINLVNQGLAPRAAMKTVGAHYRLTARQVYAIVHAL